MVPVVGSAIGKEAQEAQQAGVSSRICRLPTPLATLRGLSTTTEVCRTITAEVQGLMQYAREETLIPGVIGKGGDPLNSHGDEPAKGPACHAKKKLMASRCLCLGQDVRQPVPASAGQEQEELAARAGDWGGL